MDDSGNVYAAYGSYVLLLAGSTTSGQLVSTLFSLVGEPGGKANITPFGLDVSGNEMLVVTRSNGAVYRYRLPRP